MAFGETPWVDRTLRSVWNAIAERVPLEWLPMQLNPPAYLLTAEGQSQVPEILKRAKPPFKEHGCGVYGCVLPTSDPEVVLKVTSDPTEAGFVAAYQKLDQEEGIVKYHKILRVASGSYRKRPVWLIWRSAAEQVGMAIDLKLRSADRYDKQVSGEAEDLLGSMIDFGRQIRPRMDRLLKRVPPDVAYGTVWELYNTAEVPVWEPPPRRYSWEVEPKRPFPYGRGPSAIAQGLRVCYDIAQNMANTNFIYQVGAALANLLEEGILLADVHRYNIGADQNGNWIITDPGHAVFFHPKWATLPPVEAI